MTMDHLPEQYVALDERLRNEGLCIVPIKPSDAMKDAAAQAMRKRKEAMGSEWFLVDNKTKAAIRWTAMLNAWWAARFAHDHAAVKS